MKKSLFYVLTGALCILSACYKEIEKPEENQESSGEKKMIMEQVSVKSENDGSETKVSIDGSNYYHWTTNDYMGYFVTNDKGASFVKKTSSAYDTGTGKFTLSYEEGYERGGYGVIPASFAKSFAKSEETETLTVTYPDSYDISADIADGRYDNRGTYIPVPMVAVNSGDNMTFYSIGALVKVTMSNIPAGTKTLYVTFNQTVTGDFTVTNPGTATPTVEVADAENKTTVAITVSEDGLTAAQAANPIVLYIPVPTTTGLGIASSATTKATVSRNKGYAWAVNAITYTGDKGYFQITDGTYEFASGNLLAYKTTGGKADITFSFEDALISTRGEMNNDPHLTGDATKGYVIARSISPLLSELGTDANGYVYQDVFSWDVLRAIVGDLPDDTKKGAGYYLTDDEKYTWNSSYYQDPETGDVRHDYYNFANNAIVIGTKTWSVPTEWFWRSFTRVYDGVYYKYDVNRTGVLATVSGMTNAQFAIVKVFVTGTAYEGYGYLFGEEKYIPGMFFFPDGYVDQTDLLSLPNNREFYFDKAHNISYEQYVQMVSNGAVFLNASGMHIEADPDPANWPWSWAPLGTDSNRFAGYYISSTMSFSFNRDTQEFDPHTSGNFTLQGYNLVAELGTASASRPLERSYLVRLVRKVK